MGRGCPLPTGGGGWGPEKVLILALNMVSFGAFWVVFFTVQLAYLFYTKNRCSLVPLPIFFLIFRFLHFGVGKSSMPTPHCEKVTAKPA